MAGTNCSGKNAGHSKQREDYRELRTTQGISFHVRKQSLAQLHRLKMECQFYHDKGLGQAKSIVIAK